MAKLIIDPVTGKKIERWNTKTHSFSTQSAPTKIGCDDLYKNHSHQKQTSATRDVSREDTIRRANARNEETYRAVKKAQQKTGYKAKGNHKNTSKTTPKKDGLAIASIVLGFIALISALDGDFQLIFVILSLVFGIKSAKTSKLAVVGIVVSILALVIGATMLIALFAYDLVGIFD